MKKHQNSDKNIGWKRECECELRGWIEGKIWRGCDHSLFGTVKGSCEWMLKMDFQDQNQTPSMDDSCNLFSLLTFILTTLIFLLLTKQNKKTTLTFLG